MTEIAIGFTTEEVVKLISCCNQAIINIEDRIHDNSSASTYPSINGVTLQGSRDKIWEIKTKIKNAMIDSLGQSTKNNIKVILDITEWIKLNGCCNGTIESEEKTINLLPLHSNCITTCNESIQKITDIKYKIKQNLNGIYGYSQVF